MYFETESCPDRIISGMPIFSSKEDCIIHFYSLDLVKRNRFDFALYALYPNSLDRLFKQLYLNNINKGVILPFTKSNPTIIHIPCCNESNDEFDIDMAILGIDKLIYAIRDLKKLDFIKSVALDKDSSKIEIIKYIENNDLKVKIY